MRNSFAQNCFILTMLCFGVSGIQLHADTILLRNGRTLECNIISETPEYVEISMGTGSMTLPRDRIEKLVHTDSAQEHSYGGGKIYSAQNAPPAYADLAADFRVLIRQRNEALDAQYMMRLHEQETEKLTEMIKRLTREINALKRELAANSEQIAAIKLPESTPRTLAEVNAYNQLITQKQKLWNENNALYARIGPLVEQCAQADNKIIELHQKYKDEIQPIVRYQAALQDFQNQFAERKRTIPEHPVDTTAELFKTIDRFIVRFQREMTTHRIASEKVGNSTMVHVLINGSIVGEFVFDTGATIMTVSESLAQELGIDVESLPATKLVLADGTETEARTFILKSVAVNEAMASNVEACVVPDSPNMLGDGLLGMSFLRHFVVRINGTTGEIELTKLQADISD